MGSRSERRKVIVEFKKVRSSGVIIGTDAPNIFKCSDQSYSKRAIMDERIERQRKPRKCPACGQRPVASGVYGLPSCIEDLEYKQEAGEIVIGGCVSQPYIDPAWHWIDCKQISEEQPESGSIGYQGCYPYNNSMD